MSCVHFVAPFFMEATLRFIEATASLPGIRLGVISQDPEEKLPLRLRQRLSGHYRIEDGLDPARIAAASRALAPRTGPPQRMIAALEQLQVPLAEARAALGVPGMCVETARNFREKSRMKTLFEGAGIPCARHCLARGEDAAWEFARRSGYPLVAKPPAGAGARSTFRVDGDSQLRDVLGFAAPSPAEPLLLEEFVQGEEHSFDSVFIEGRPVWHSISRYSPTPLEVLNQPWIQWTVLLPRDIATPEYDDIRAAATSALRVLGLRTALTHMEWFRRPDGSLAISEVAARPPGAQFMTLLSHAHEVDFYRAWAELMVLDRFEAAPRRFACGAAFLRGQGRGRVTRVLGLDEAWSEVGPMVVEARMPQAGQSPTGTYEGDGYVILRHEDTARVEAGLRRLVSLIRVQLEEA